MENQSDSKEGRSPKAKSASDSASDATAYGRHKRLVACRFIEANVATLTRDMILVCSGDKSVLTDFETLAGPPPAAS